MPATSLQSLQSHDILQRTLQLLIQDNSMKIITNSMQGTQSLALLANIVQLFYLEPMKNAIESGYPNFTTICLKLLQSIPNTVGPKGGAVSQWHEVLGWYSPTPESPPNENLSLIKKQIYLLWSHRIVKLLLVDKLKELSVGYGKVDFPNPHHISSNLFKRALELGTTKTNQINKNNKPWRKLVGDETKQVIQVCSMYHSALNTLSQLKLDILSGERVNLIL